VGFHADPSDVEITFKFFHLPHDIELITAALFEQHSLSQHEHAYLVTLLNAYVRHSHGIVNGFAVVASNDKDHFHTLSPISTELFIATGIGIPEDPSPYTKTLTAGQASDEIERLR
jgi:hypothetical protein